MTRNKYVSFLSLLMIFVLLTGCSGRRKEQTQVTQNPDALKVYCINNAETRVVSETFVPEEKEGENLIRELLGRLAENPADLSFKRAIPDEIRVNGFTLADGIVTVDFSESYRSLEKISEVLRRACVVKTLCQVEGVSYVQFTVSSQPLMRTETMPVGMMNAEQFIDNTGGETTYDQTVTLTLYFTDENGEQLVKTRHQIQFDGTISLEELVIRQLIAGPLPADKNMLGTIPEGTELIKVNRQDATCYIDFSEEFLGKVTGVSDQIVIYSVVNSICELSGVSKVQFTINGETKTRYRESIPFDGFFERNLELVKTEN